MKVSFLDLKLQYQEIEQPINSAIKRVLDRQSFILGEEVGLFEQEFAKYTETKAVVSVNSGTDALILSLRALGVKKGDEVITQSNSFIATTLAITELGAVPIFIDINPDTLQIDERKIEEKVTDKTKVILIVHLFGACGNIKKIKSIAKKYNLFLVEDSAQSVGSSYEGRKLGSFGDLAAFSFYPGKNLGAYGDAGAIAVNNPKFLKKIQQLKNYGQTEKYHHKILGLNSRMDEIQAAILRVKLKYVDRWNKKRNNLVNLYKKNLSKQVIQIELEKGVFSNNHLFVVRVKNRESLQKYLLNFDIQTLIHYPIPIHLQVCYKDMGFNLKNLKETEKAAKEIISLPLYPELSEVEVRYVINCINDYCEK